MSVHTRIAWSSLIYQCVPCKRTLVSEDGLGFYVLRFSLCHKENGVDSNCED